MNPLILETVELSRPWVGVDPFLFCVYHHDRYRASDGALGVRPEDMGERPLGSDFSGLHGFSMYYGETVPGFPAHPHRGFETVTIVRQGYVDHADSLGARARYGMGDVQWLTAGCGIQHAEMFPLLQADRDNPLELFQIWLNLPARSKMVPPAFRMLWAEEIPVHRSAGAQVTVMAGTFRPVDGSPALVPPPPAPDSWASDPQSDLALWLVRLEPGAQITLPPAMESITQRTLYVFEGEAVEVSGQAVEGKSLARVNALCNLPLANASSQPVELLLMQAVPLNEPVAAAGPFVMNTAQQLQEARREFGRTQFGGWPWDTRAPTHGPEPRRFAQYPDGERVEPPQR